MVVTVLGPVAPAAIGPTDAHDHLFLRTPVLAGQEIDELERSIEEAELAAASGLSTIVDMTPIGCGRRPSALRELATRAGLHVVAASGYHRDAHYPADHWVRTATTKRLADRITRDLIDGIDSDDWSGPDAVPDLARAGVVKAGASYHHISAGEDRRLEAGAVAVRRTGAPILIHCEIGTAAHQILDRLEALSIPLDRVILSHLDRNPDPQLHAEIAARGPFLEYDTVGRIKYRPDSQLLTLIESMVTAGHLGQLLVGMDLGRRDYFRAYGGGPGIAYLMAVFVPRLERLIGQSGVERILVENPRRAFVWRRALEAPE